MLIDTNGNTISDIVMTGDVFDSSSWVADSSVDMIFADPPYNLQLKNDLWRPNNTAVNAVSDEWDQFDSFQQYDYFTESWLKEAHRMLKPTGTIWVSGTYHNIFRVGNIMQDMGFWILNTIVWHKPNAMPNFRGTRLKNDVEFVIWAKKSESSTYTFNHHDMKAYNDAKQLGSVWTIPVCGGSERLKDANGKKLHSTQKPEELLERIILASTVPGDIVLDPFLGTGTTAVVAKRFHRHYIGIELDDTYVAAAIERIKNVEPIDNNDQRLRSSSINKPARVSFKTLIDLGFIKEGDLLAFSRNKNPADIFEFNPARVLASGMIEHNGETGSIHQIGAMILGSQSCNGWEHWLVHKSNEFAFIPINHYRELIRRKDTNDNISQ